MLKKKYFRDLFTDYVKETLDPEQVMKTWDIGEDQFNSTLEAFIDYNIEMIRKHFDKELLDWLEEIFSENVDCPHCRDGACSHWKMKDMTAFKHQLIAWLVQYALGFYLNLKDHITEILEVRIAAKTLSGMERNSRFCDGCERSRNGICDMFMEADVCHNEIELFYAAGVLSGRKQVPKDCLRIDSFQKAVKSA
ncbi:MAG TPA: hypothetical protein DCZ94_20070 [Lentisphaeria bacterium]|nr:MAG: hypothetical protein A2X48_14715 [Lentisphaerae bacterium GWF2_49_21]HBC89243.1 hypothetical protein [Lentisphaeria bacterium]